MQNNDAQVVSRSQPLLNRFSLAEVVDQGFRFARFRFKRLQRKARQRAMPLRVFAQELLRAPREVGAVCPSSRDLGLAMAEAIKWDDNRLVIELGAGTGSVTQALLQQGVPANRLIVLERSESLVRGLRQRFPMLTIIHGDAADLPTLLKDREEDIGNIVSSLPLRSLKPVAADAILAGILDTLADDGRLIQFTYDLRKSSVPERLELHRVASRRVWLNLPPARVDVFDYQASGKAQVTTKTRC